VPLPTFRLLAACLPRLLRADLAAVSGVPVSQVLLSSVGASGGGGGTTVRFTLLLPRSAASTPSSGASATPSVLPSVVVAPSPLASPSPGAPAVSERAVEVRTRLALVMGGDTSFRDAFRGSIALTTEVLTQTIDGGGGGGGSGNGTTGNATAPISTSLITSDVGAPSAQSVQEAAPQIWWGGVIAGTVVGAVAAVVVAAYAFLRTAQRQAKPEPQPAADQEAPADGAASGAVAPDPLGLIVADIEGAGTPATSAQVGTSV